MALAFGLALWAWALGWAVLDYPIYRDQHLGAAIEYHKNGIDLLRPVVPGFNATGTGTPQEFPLWQATAAVALNLSGGWWGAANVVSLLLFSAALIPFYLLCRREASSLECAGAPPGPQTGKHSALARELGWLGVALLLCQPLVFHLAGAAQTDGLALSLLLCFMWAGERLRRSGALADAGLAAVFGILLALTKLPYFMAGGIAAALMLLWNRETSRRWLLLAAVGLLAAAVFLVWNRWCEAEIGRAEFRYRAVMLKEMPQWFFGDLAYRLDPMNYIKGGWRALASLWGSFVLIGLSLYGLWRRPKSPGSALLIGALVVSLIFFKLVFTHRHYYLMYAPAVALLNLYALAPLWCRLASKDAPIRWLASGAGVAILFLALFQGLMAIEAFIQSDPHPRKLGRIIREHVAADEKILLAGGGWGGNVFLHAERDGLSIDSTDFLSDPVALGRLRELGYAKLVAVSESPLLHAVQKANPGSAARTRKTHEQYLSVADGELETLYRDEHIIIKRIE